MPRKEESFILEIEEILGVGAFGCVFKAKGRPYAYKYMGWEFNYLEITTLFRSDHQHVARAFQIWTTDAKQPQYNEEGELTVRKLELYENGTHECLVIEMPLYRTNLLRWVSGDEGEIPGFRQKLLASYQLALGLRFLHYTGIAHLDLKLENCMLDFDGDALVGDFGRARYLEQTGFYISKQDLFTDGYRPPEYCGRGKRRKHDFTADIWSLGIVFASLLYGSHLLTLSDQNRLITKKFGTEKSVRETLQKKLGGILVDCPDFMELIVWMLQPHPEDRPKIKEVLEHKAFREFQGYKPRGSVIFTRCDVGVDRVLANFQHFLYSATKYVVSRTEIKNWSGQPFTLSVLFTAADQFLYLMAKSTKTDHAIAIALILAMKAHNVEYSIESVASKYGMKIDEDSLYPLFHKGSYYISCLLNNEFDTVQCECRLREFLDSIYLDTRSFLERRHQIHTDPDDTKVFRAERRGCGCKPISWNISDWKEELLRRVEQMNQEMID